MQYSPKLKMAMAEISAIMEKYDIAGSVVLHAPGHSEYKMFLEPSYSVARFKGSELRIQMTSEKMKTEEGSKQLAETANMIALLLEPMYNLTEGLLSMSEMLDVHVLHTDSEHTSEEQQNN